VVTVDVSRWRLLAIGGNDNFLGLFSQRQSVSRFDTRLGKSSVSDAAMKIAIVTQAAKEGVEHDLL
jgi:hypothetical protein